MASVLHLQRMQQVHMTLKVMSDVILRIFDRWGAPDVSNMVII